MADIKLGEPFGMEAQALSELNLPLSIDRILNDVKTDFIYAPHLNLIYGQASDELQSEVLSNLKAGNFHPASQSP